MTRPGLWILVCAVGCFATGMSAGLALPSVVEACCGEAADQDPDELYIERFAQDFDLNKEQKRALRFVLQQFTEEELDVFRRADRDQLPESVRSELMAARRRQIDRIRVLLDEEQRAQYDQRDPSRRLGEVR